MSTSTYTGPTYSLAPREYVCNTCGHREPVGRSNNMGATEGAPPMLRHLRDKHGYQPKYGDIADWQECVLRPDVEAKA